MRELLQRLRTVRDDRWQAGAERLAALLVHRETMRAYRELAVVSRAGDVSAMLRIARANIDLPGWDARVDMYERLALAVTANTLGLPWPADLVLGNATMSED